MKGSLTLEAYKAKEGLKSYISYLKSLGLTEEEVSLKLSDEGVTGDWDIIKRRKCDPEAIVHLRATIKKKLEANQTPYYTPIVSTS